jgi:hypothetical protein
MFAHASFNQQDDQQGHHANYDRHDSSAEPLAATLLKVRTLQAGRNLEGIQSVHKLLNKCGKHVWCQEKWVVDNDKTDAFVSVRGKLPNSLNGPSYFSSDLCR